MRYFALALLVALLGVVPAKPYTFTPNTSISSAQVNADFDALYSALNANIDNTNIGAAGIYASQINPTTVGQATFGGSVVYDFPLGLTIPGVVPNSCAVWDANSVLSGSTPCVSTATTNIFTQLNDFTAGVAITNAAAITGGLTVDTLTVSAAVTNGAKIVPASDGTLALLTIRNAANSLSLLRYDSLDAHNGALYVTKNDKLGVISPAFTAAGNQIGSTYHTVSDTCTFAAATTCTASFTGGAVFASSTSYVCTAVGPSTVSMTIPTSYAAASVVLSAFTISTGAALSNSATVRYRCEGT